MLLGFFGVCCFGALSPLGGGFVLAFPLGLVLFTSDTMFRTKGQVALEGNFGFVQDKSDLKSASDKKINTAWLKIFLKINYSKQFQKSLKSLVA